MPTERLAAQRYNTTTTLEYTYLWALAQNSVLHLHAPAVLLCKLQAEVISLSASLNGTAKLLRADVTATDRIPLYAAQVRLG